MQRHQTGTSPKISKEKAATVALNALQLTLWLNLCGGDTWTIAFSLTATTERFWEGADGTSIKINQHGLHMEGRGEKGKGYKRRRSNENRGSKIKRETL